MLENRILFDWLTFTLPSEMLDSVRPILGLSSVPFQEINSWRNGYGKRITYAGISILSEGAVEGMGICVDMTGQGCRTYETFGANDWYGLFQLIRDNGWNITRLDVAYDDFSGILPLQVMLEDTLDHAYVSKSRTWMVQHGSSGTTIYHGSVRSDMLIRIYDKAAEQKQDGHWIRVEMQMRHKVASGFIAGDDVGKYFRGVLRNYLRYVEPNGDSNQSRWPTAPYWEELLDGVERIRVWSCPGVDYSIFHLEAYVVGQAGHAIKTYKRIVGPEQFAAKINELVDNPNPKYDHLVEQYGEYYDRVAKAKEDRERCLNSID